MEITDVRCVRLDGTLDGVDPETYYEDRLATPLDVYDEFNERETFTTNVDDIFPHVEDGAVRVSQRFLHVDTDEGVTGIAGPVDRTPAALALGLRDLLVGRDPLATEKLWDLMYRREVHGRRGKTMLAVSALDCALWDLKGKWYDEPVHRLLGGPTREELPAYASMFMYAVDPESVAERVGEFRDRGYEAQKWFFRHGPGSGREGVAENLALVEAAREAAGESYDLMFDAWMSWDRAYALEMLDRLEPFRPRWVEEPVHADRPDVLAELSAASSVPVAGGEHEYTRWGFHDLLERGALDVLQPDAFWAGGITETTKICTLASAYDVPVVIHGHSVPTNVHLSAAQPPSVCPSVEYLVKLNEGLQHFFEDPVKPTGGVIEVPDRPGLGIDIDRSAVEAETEVEGGA